MTLNPHIFKGAVLYMGILQVAYVSYIILVLNTSFQAKTFNWILLVLIPLYMLCLLAGVYICYFLAKCLNSVEYGRDTKPSEYIIDIILLWFFMLGIWFIQPRINKLVEADQDDSV